MQPKPANVKLSVTVEFEKSQRIIKVTTIQRNHECFYYMPIQEVFVQIFQAGSTCLVL